MLFSSTGGEGGLRLTGHGYEGSANKIYLKKKPDTVFIFYFLCIMQSMKHTPNFDAAYLKNFFDYDPFTGRFARKFAWGSQIAGSEPGGLSPQGYWQIGVKSRTYPAHRLAWLYVYGSWPDSLIDHINCNKLDNRIGNLRLSCYSKNAQNLPSSRVRGVSNKRNKKQKPWVAYISVQGTRLHLGCFATFDEAIAVRKKAEADLL